MNNNLIKIEVKYCYIFNILNKNYKNLLKKKKKRKMVILLFSRKNNQKEKISRLYPGYVGNSTSTTKISYSFSCHNFYTCNLIDVVW